MTKLSTSTTRSAFAKAWDIAREGAARFGGSVRSYFRFAIYEAYAALRPRPSRKEIVGVLDAGARKADTASWGLGATSRQTWFLAGLLEQIGTSFAELAYVCDRGMLTKTSASRQIDDCLAVVNKTA